MPTLPAAMVPVPAAFAPLFSRRVWGHARALLAGALLAPAQRTVAAAPRVVGLDRIAQFHRHHRVLGRARWSGLAASRVLLRLLVAAFAPAGPLLVGVDETPERRRGKRVAPKGIYRDAVRSSRGRFVKASGPRRVRPMLLVPIPRAARTWALPVLAALAPSGRYGRGRGRRRKTPTDWARRLRLVVRRWRPDRALVAVADSTYAALEFLAAGRSWRAPAAAATRRRLDAALDEPAPPRRPRQTGRPRRKGKRPPALAAVAAGPATARTGVTGRAGTAPARARPRSPPTRPSGTTPGCRSCPCAGR